MGDNKTQPNAQAGRTSQASGVAGEVGVPHSSVDLHYFKGLAAKYSGTDEGYIAEYYLGCIAADQGKLGEADKRFSSVADSAGKKYASLAKLSLGQLYFAEGKPGPGEQMLRSLMDNPTVFVSTDQAAIMLARMLAPTKPAEARKLLGPLRAKPGSVSQAAIQAYGELPPQ